MTRRVSSSGRTCGRPRQRLSWVVSVSAMLLDDACHSIDSGKVCPILENNKFPNSAAASGANVMTRHSTAFEAERLVPVDDTVKDLLLDTQSKSTVGESVPAAAPGKKFSFRKVLMAGAAAAVL